MEYNRLNSKAKTSWFLGRLITTLIIATILIGGYFTLKEVFHFGFVIRYKTPIIIVIILILILLLINTFIYPIIEYNQWKYMITEDKVDFTEGIYYTKRTIVPIIRIQHIKVEEGPINKFFKLANITLGTAGGSHVIPNIEIEKAKEISDYLKDRIKEKVEENE